MSTKETKLNHSAKQKKDITKISKLIPGNTKSGNQVELKNWDNFNKSIKECVYAFWLLNKSISRKQLNLTVILKGRKKTGKNGHHKHEIKWKYDKNAEFICLYAGKTHDLNKRVPQHLMKKTENWYEPLKQGDQPPDTDYVFKRNTVCQLRAGLERLFHGKAKFKSLESKLDHILLTWIEVEKVEDRFYLEDLAIGYFRPWFNVDSER